MRDHGSIGLFLGNGLFFVGNLALSVLGLFLFCFCLVWGEQVTDAQDFGQQSKGEDHFRSWFPFFSRLLGDNSVLFRCCLVQRPFCIFLLFSSDPWSGIFFLIFYTFSLLPPLLLPLFSLSSVLPHLPSLTFFFFYFIFYMLSLFFLTFLYSIICIAYTTIKNYKIIF